MHITAQGPQLRNDLYCVEWDVIIIIIMFIKQKGLTTTHIA